MKTYREGNHFRINISREEYEFLRGLVELTIDRMSSSDYQAVIGQNKEETYRFWNSFKDSVATDENKALTSIAVRSDLSAINNILTVYTCAPSSFSLGDATEAQIDEAEGLFSNLHDFLREERARKKKAGGSSKKRHNRSRKVLKQRCNLYGRKNKIALFLNSKRGGPGCIATSVGVAENNELTAASAILAIRNSYLEDFITCFARAVEQISTNSSVSDLHVCEIKDLLAISLQTGDDLEASHDPTDIRLTLDIQSELMRGERRDGFSLNVSVDTLRSFASCLNEVSDYITTGR